MQQVKALPLPETKQEREARLSTALGVSSGIPSCMPSAAVPAPIEEDEDMHHGQDDMPDFDLGDAEGELPVRASAASACVNGHTQWASRLAGCHAPSVPHRLETTAWSV